MIHKISTIYSNNNITEKDITVKKSAQILQGMNFILNWLSSTKLKAPAQVSPGIIKLLQFGWNWFKNLTEIQKEWNEARPGAGLRKLFCPGQATSEPEPM